MKPITLETYARLTGFSEQELIGRSRIIEVAIAREFYWYWMRRRGAKVVALAHQFNRKHPTLVSGIRHIEGLIYTNDPLIRDYLSLIDTFSHQRN